MTFEEINARNRKRFSLSAKKAHIRANKAKLANEDYKIIKCAEAVIAAYVAEHPDVEMPYDVVELIANRKIARDTINATEVEVAEIEAEIAG